MNVQKLIAIVLLVSMMFDAGLQANRAHLLAILKDYPLLARALLANFIIVPLLGLIFARAFHLADPVATGLLLMAIAPGVPFVILAGGTQKGGSLAFAVTLALILPALSTLTIPIAAHLVLPPNAGAHLPPSQLISLFIFQLVPLVVGSIVAARLPSVAKVLARPAKIVMFASLIALLAILAPMIGGSVARIYGSLGMLAMLATVAGSLVAGWLLGGKKREYRRTLAMGTALRNPAVAMVIATAAFHDTLVTSAVVAYFLVQAVVAALVGIAFKRVEPAAA